MKNLTAHNSNYKISDKNDSEKGIFIPELKKMIIGIPKEYDINSDDATLLLEHQVLSVDIPNYFTRLFQLPNDARNTIEKAVNVLDDNNKFKVHMGRNLDNVIKYSFYRYGLHLAELIKTLFPVNDVSDMTKHIATLDKAVKTATFRFPSQLLSGYICAFNLISPTFCNDGKGFIYLFNNRIKEFSKDEIGAKYNELIYNAYENALDKSYKNKEDINISDISEIFNIKKILDEELNLTGAYEECEIQSMYKNVHLDNYYSDLIQAMLS